MIANLRQTWQGEASDAFQRASAHFDPAMADYAKQLMDAAASLENIAGALEEAQVQARHFEQMLYITVGITLAAGLFTFGTADVFALGLIEAQSTVLEVFLARLAALFSGEARAFILFMRAMSVTMQRFAYGLGLNVAATGLVKGLLAHDNIFDPASYSAKDYTNLLMASMATLSLGVLGGTNTIGGWLNAHPILGVGAAGGFGGGALAGIGQTWLNGNPPWSMEWLRSVGLTTLISGMSGLGVGGASVAGPALRGTFSAPVDPPTEPFAAVADPPTEPIPAIADPPTEPFAAVADPPTEPFPAITPPELKAVTKGDLLRGGSGIPADAAEYAVTIPQEQLKEQVPVPAAAAIEVAAPPANTVVTGGDSLWAIAKREYGDGRKYMLIAEANHIEDPTRIDPEQNLIIPPDPQPSN